VTALADLADLVTEALLRAGEQLDSRISGPQLRLLGVVDRLGGPNLTSVAAEIGGALPSVSRLVDRLVASGLLTRAPSERNRREVDLRLTRAGQQVLRTWDQARSAELAASVRRLSPGRRVKVAEAVIDGSRPGQLPLDGATTVPSGVVDAAPPGAGAGAGGAAAAGGAAGAAAAGRLVEALLAAEPDTLAQVFAEQVAGAVGADRVVVWLTDFRVATLVPVAHVGGKGAPDPLDVDGPDPVGVCLREQHPVHPPEGADQLNVPITLKSEPAGVLSVGGSTMAADRVEQLGRALAAAFALALPGLTRGSDHLAELRRSREFTVSAEMQWQQLGARAFRSSRFAIAGQVEPAYAGGSESYEWACDADRLQLGLFDCSGDRGVAALTTALVLGALRNARRGGYPTDRQATLVDEAVWEMFGGRTAAEALLLDVHLDGSGRSVVLGTGGVTLFRHRDGRVRVVDLDAQLPLGMFEDSRYQVQPLDVRSGDRLVVISDGVLRPGAAERQHGEFADLLATHRRLAPAELVRRLLRLIPDDPTGDATVVCLDVHPD